MEFKDAKGLLDLLRARRKVLARSWFDSARECLEIYECKDKDRVPFNILFSNTQTLLPTLYNSTPRPEVSRRYTDVAAQTRVVDVAVSKAAERLLEYLVDSNFGEYEGYSEATQDAVLSMLIAGLGQVRVRYVELEGYQKVCFESVPYDRFLWSPGRRWSNVSWVAFGHDMARHDFEKTFPEFCRTDEYKDFKWETLSEEEELRSGTSQEPQPVGPAILVWEVWHCPTRTVYFVCEQFSQYLHEEPYPTHLTGRFPCPRPLVFATQGHSWVPVPPYRFYERQAKELNEITRRIHRVVKAIRARGIYSGTNSALQQLVQEDDDAILVPSEDAAAFQDGIDKAIWFMPVDVLVRTLQELYVAQQNCIQSIYQIMGISDIQRGSTDPEETAKAQQIKNQWGSLRVKKLQRDVQVFCRDAFRTAFEFAVSYFSPATWKSITRLPYLLDAQRVELGQNPNPPPEVQALLVLPTWEQVLQVFRSNFERTYRVDIETNSTVDLEATEDKLAISEFMAAFGQIISSFTPLVEAQAIPFEAVRVVLGEVARRFRFGRRVEEALEYLQPPQPPQPPMADLLKSMQAEMEARIERVRAEGAKRLLEAEQAISDREAQINQLRTQLAELKAEGKVREVELKSNFASATAQQRESAQKRISTAEQQAMEAKSNLLLSRISEAMRQLEESKKVAAETANRTEEQQAQLLQALTTFVQAQQQTQEALQQLLRAQTATRETELIIGPDGRKRSISRIVQ